MALELRDYQQQGIDDIRDAFRRRQRRVIYVLATGGGKCLGKGAPILMYDGSIRPVEFIKPGDLLMGPDSKPRSVLNTCSGVDQLYLVTPVKGDSYVVNSNHILSLKIGLKKKRVTGGNGVIYDNGDIANISVTDYLKSSNTFRHVAKGWRTGIDFQDTGAILRIPPYILGVWLGDGTSRGTTITNADYEVISELKKYASDIPGFSCKKLACGDLIYNISKDGPERRDGQNPFLNALRDYDLILNKHIPHIYKTSSRFDRLEILAGIIDTDGYAHHGGYDAVFKQKQLADDVAFVARSLGLAAYVKECQKTATNTGATGTYYRVHISGDASIIPVRVERRKVNERQQRKSVLVTGITVKPIGIGEYYGFETDGDHLFMLGDFTVTHNSVLSTYMAKAAFDRGSRTLFHAHSEELVSNLKKALSGWGIPHGVIEPGHRETNHIIQVARTKTVANRIRKHLAMLERITDPEKRARLADKYRFDLVVSDEAHHVCSGNTWWYVLEHNPDAFHLGVTATPARLDGKPLGREYGGWWEDMVVGPSVMDLIEHPDGPFLCPPVVYQADKSKLPDFSQLRKQGGDYKTSQLSALMAGSGRFVYGDAVGEYRSKVSGMPGISFCVDVQAAEQCAEQFRVGGYQSTVLIADTPNRPQILRDLGDGKLHMVTSVMALTEGVDVPAAQVGFMLRKTASLVLCRQMAGRLMRIFPGKDKCYLFDSVGNTFDDNHGLPTDDIEWSLDHKPRKKQQREAGEAAGRQCGNCFAWNPPRVKACLECNEPFKKAESGQIDMIDGELTAVDAVEISRQRRARRAELEPVINSVSTPLAELHRIAKELGYKPGWAFHQHRMNRNKWQGAKKYGT